MLSKLRLKQVFLANVSHGLPEKPLGSVLKCAKENAARDAVPQV